MIKYYVTELDPKMSLAELYPEGKKEMTNVPWPVLGQQAKYFSNLLNSPNVFANNANLVLGMLSPVRENGAPCFMLISLNMLLWLGMLGATESESQLLYQTLAKETRKLTKVERLPVTSSFANMLKNKQAFTNPADRKYLQLQALITSLCVAMSGVKESRERELDTILRKASPSIVGAMSWPKDKAMHKPMYKAVWYDKATDKAVSLLTVVSAPELIIMTKYLTLRASEAISGNHPMQTRRLDRIKFFTQLLTTMSMSLEDAPDKCWDLAPIYGRLQLW